MSRPAVLGALVLFAVPGVVQAQGPPNAPIDLEVRSHDDHFHVTWDEDDSGNRMDALFFRVYRDNVIVGTSGNRSFTDDDDDLTFGTSYTYEVTGVDLLGREGARSAPVSAVLIDDSPPDKPDDLEATAVSASRIDLTWEGSEDDDSGIAGYYIYRNGGSSPHDSTTTTGYSDTGLSSYTVYRYRVSAFNSSHAESGLSNEAQARTFDGTPPSAPGALSAMGVSSTAISLTWTAAADAQSGIQKYYVYRDGGGSPLDSTTATNYTDAGAAGGGQRTYQVAAVNGVGIIGPRSNTASASPLDGSPPSVPSGLTAAAEAARLVTLSWNAASDPESGVTRYLVYRDGSENAIDSTTATSFEDGGVEPETEYTYRISARNGAGLESAPSSPASVTTPPATDGTVPSVPGDFAATATGPGRVELTWTAAQDAESGISEYRIYRDGARIGASPGGGFVDLTVEPGEAYAYEVSAVNGDGLEGPRSAAVSVTTPAGGDEGDTIPPAPPTDLRVISA